MREVVVNCIVDKKELIDVLAMFHQWGIDYEEFEAGPGSYSVGIVEFGDGTIQLLHPSLFKFVNPVSLNPILNESTLA